MRLDHPSEAADRNLRVAISQLRQALEPDLPLIVGWRIFARQSDEFAYRL